MTWRRLQVLIRGLPADGAWAHWMRTRHEQPITNPQEAKDVLGQLYPGLN